jgi:hypothetical protein
MIRTGSVLVYAVLAFVLAGFAHRSAAYDFNDSHFHLTNYIQEGISLPEFLRVMDNKTGRAAVFGIPLQQKWDYFESGARAPTIIYSRMRSFTTIRSRTRSSPINTCTLSPGIARGSIP